MVPIIAVVKRAGTSPAAELLIAVCIEDGCARLFRSPKRGACQAASSMHKGDVYVLVSVSNTVTNMLDYSKVTSRRGPAVQRMLVVELADNTGAANPFGLDGVWRTTEVCDDDHNAQAWVPLSHRLRTSGRSLTAAHGVWLRVSLKELHDGGVLTAARLTVALDADALKQLDEQLRGTVPGKPVVMQLVPETPLAYCDGMDHDRAECLQAVVGVHGVLETSAVAHADEDPAHTHPTDCVPSAAAVCAAMHALLRDARRALLRTCEREVTSSFECFADAYTDQAAPSPSPPTCNAATNCDVPLVVCTAAQTDARAQPAPVPERSRPTASPVATQRTSTPRRTTSAGRSSEASVVTAATSRDSTPSAARPQRRPSPRPAPATATSGTSASADRREARRRLLEGALALRTQRDAPANVSVNASSSVAARPLLSMNTQEMQRATSGTRRRSPSVRGPSPNRGPVVAAVVAPPARSMRRSSPAPTPRLGALAVGGRR